MSEVINWQLPHLYALLLSQGGGRWRWVLQDAEPEPVWALLLEQESSATPCGIYAVGEVLTLPARVFAMVTPDVLRAVSQQAVLVEEALERMQRLEWLLQRLQNRAYKLHRRDEYLDIRQARVESQLAQRLLRASEPPLAHEVEQWRREIDAEMSSPDGTG